jgi:hypothetical protein
MDKYIVASNGHVLTRNGITKRNKIKKVKVTKATKRRIY